VIGSNTVGSLQSGLYYGYLGLVDGILELLLKELGPETPGIATGGLGSMIGTGSKYIKHVDEFLTLEGLRIIWERNAGARRETGTKSASKSGAIPDTSKALPRESKGQKNSKEKNGVRSAR
jgi:type III pantothenate kinase